MAAERAAQYLEGELRRLVKAHQEAGTAAEEDDNGQVIALMTACAQAFRVESGAEAIALFAESMRIIQVSRNGKNRTEFVGGCVAEYR